MINALFAAGKDQFPLYKPHLEVGFKALGLDVHLSTDIAPQKVDYIIYAPDSPLTDFSPYHNCKAVLNTWAGVEQIIGNPTLTQPLCRMVDPGMTSSMSEYVTGNVLRYHLNLDASIINPEKKWNIPAPPLARQRRVAILGLGELGQACAGMLHRLGFQVAGWSRRPKAMKGIECYSGTQGLEAILPKAQICVLLLPQTAQTQNILNADTLAQMPKGAYIINPGRGTLIDDTALIESLDAGHIAHATLDVFRREPLPLSHPFWSHPKVTVTPHIAATTREETAAQAIAENIFRGQNNQPFLYLVDRKAEY